MCSGTVNGLVVSDWSIAQVNKLVRASPVDKIIKFWFACRKPGNQSCLTCTQKMSDNIIKLFII